MTGNLASDFSAAGPEIFLACVAMLLLMLGAFRGESASRTISWLAVLAFAVAYVFLLATPNDGTQAFGGLFVSDRFALFMKSLVLLGSALAVVISMGYTRAEQMDRFEYPILIVLATVGMLMMVSANDLLSLYLGLEMQSLPLYVLAAFKRDSNRSSEAGLKYFVLGALSSGMLLYGCSMIYGFSGTTSFTVLADQFASDSLHLGLGLIVGIVFMTAGLAFKVSAVPFHMWTPDVYEGAPTPITAFFAIAPKIAAIALFLRALLGPFPDLVDEWRQIIVFISVASMVLGAFAAINQTNIKRLMAYSSIGHVGFALLGLAAGTQEGVRAVLVYMAIYLAMTAGAFTCILCMRQKSGMVEEISDLAGLSRSQPALGLVFALFMFSLAGIPPLAGFFGKFYVFMAAINAGLYVVAIIGVLSSVVGAFYYLRVVKVIYIDEPAEPFEKPVGRAMAVVMAGTGLFTLLFFLYPAPLLTSAMGAAAALLP